MVAHPFLSDASDDPGASVVDIDEWLAGPLDYDVDTTPGDLAPPEGAEQANRYLRRYSRLEGLTQRDAEIASREHARIDEWLNERTQRRTTEQRWLLGALEAFTRVAAVRDHVRSISLPNGKLQLRKPVASFVVDDQDAFLVWATANAPDLLRTRIEPDRAAAKKVLNPGAGMSSSDPERDVTQAVTPDGEVVPGAAFTVASRDLFSVTTQEDDR